MRDDDREEGYGGSRAAPDGIIVASALAVVQAILLRVVDVVRVLDVLGNLLGPVIRRGQII